jgi:hypothetical protein
MAFELVIHAPDRDFLLGLQETWTAAEKRPLSGLPGERRSVIEVHGGPRQVAVIDFTGYRAKDNTRHSKPERPGAEAPDGLAKER